MVSEPNAPTSGSEGSGASEGVGYRVRAWVRGLRTGFWKAVYRTPGVDSTFTLSGFCNLHPDFRAGAYGFMNRGCRVASGVTVGRYVMFGPDVSIIGADHRFDLPGTPMIFSGRPERETTVIEDDVWLGSRSIILTGTRIGRGAVIAAGSVVTRDVPPYTICAGVPAKPIRPRFTDAEIERHEAALEAPTRSGTYTSPR